MKSSYSHHQQDQLNNQQEGLLTCLATPEHSHNKLILTVLYEYCDFLFTKKSYFQ